ncbi:MAG: prolyl oligopeptidase family serine peptidase [Acidobacteriota bacterium]
MSLFSLPALLSLEPAASGEIAEGHGSSHAPQVAWIWRLALLASLVAFATSAPAEVPDGYRTPPAELLELVDAPPTPLVRLSPDQSTLALFEWTTTSRLAELARPELRLAGLRFQPTTRAPSRTLPLRGMALVDLETGERREVDGLPAEPAMLRTRWAPGGAHLLFHQLAADGVELWVADVAEARARRLTEPVLNLVGVNGCRWIDADSILCPTVPTDLGPEPAADPVPPAPVVQESTGDAAPVRTFQDLLESPHDEAVFAHYMRSQPVRIDLDGRTTAIGPSDLHVTLEPSPDGSRILVETVQRPFSYQVPARRFPHRIALWSADGGERQTLFDRPLQDRIPIAFGSVAVGPREHGWRADAPASLYWAEALDGGDAGREADERDRVMLLSPPYETPRELVRLDLRFGDIQWSADDLALVSGWWWPTRRAKSWRVRPAEAEQPPELLFDISFEDRYADPGDWATRIDTRGRRVLQRSADGEALFLLGDGASTEGDRPFVDRFSLADRETTRLFRSQAPHYAEPVALLADEQRLLMRREDVSTPPNLFVARFGEGEAATDLRRLTDFPHPTPQLANIRKELIRYTRDDGVELNATLYLPPSFEPGDPPLPMVFWAYPREFKSADAAGQVDSSPYRFDRLAWYSPLVWLARGYAVLDDPKMPIVGEADEEPNDTFRRQLVASARAAAEEVVRRGVADPDRLAIGGHSYGAFMTANLLAHSDVFAAGIAQSGAYNRTLTPFGFQAEERTFWEAAETYFAMSPFMHADKIDEPILIVHGAADNNSGTYPLQSERFYAALKGLGGTARLVMLPLESHGYRARESILHLMWEIDRWLGLHLAERADGAEGAESAELETAADRSPDGPSSSEPAGRTTPLP